MPREQILLGDAFLNTLVPNPFVGLMPDAGATNTAATVQRRVLMRPLPQFGTINEQLVPIGYSNYSSIQLSWEKRLSHGVQFLVGYTGSLTKEALSPLNQGEPLYEQLTSTHRPHVLRLSGGWTQRRRSRAATGRCGTCSATGRSIPSRSSDPASRSACPAASI